MVSRSSRCSAHATVPVYQTRNCCKGATRHCGGGNAARDVAPHDNVYDKVVSNMHEVRARGGRILAITTQGTGNLAGLVDYQLRVPRIMPLLSPVLTVIPLQLLAYHVGVLRGCDVDRPRNLAKSVT